MRVVKDTIRLFVVERRHQKATEIHKAVELEKALEKKTTVK